MAYQKKTIRKASERVRPLMRIANGMELELRALRREIEAQRDLDDARRESLTRVLDEAEELGTLFHHAGREEDVGEVTTE